MSILDFGVQKYIERNLLCQLPDPSICAYTARTCTSGLRATKMAREKEKRNNEEKVEMSMM